MRGCGAKAEAAATGQNPFAQVRAARSPAGPVATGPKMREVRCLFFMSRLSNRLPVRFRAVVVPKHHASDHAGGWSPPSYGWPLATSRYPEVFVGWRPFLRNWKRPQHRVTPICHVGRVAFGLVAIGVRCLEIVDVMQSRPVCRAR